MLKTYFWLYRVEKEWKELQIEVGELFEARPQERANNTTRRKHNS